MSWYQTKGTWVAFLLGTRRWSKVVALLRNANVVEVTTVLHAVKLGIMRSTVQSCRANITITHEATEITRSVLNDLK